MTLASDRKVTLEKEIPSIKTRMPRHFPGRALKIAAHSRVLLASFFSDPSSEARDSRVCHRGSQDLNKMQQDGVQVGLLQVLARDSLILFTGLPEEGLERAHKTACIEV